MDKLFSNSWMQSFADAWNDDTEMTASLGTEKFSAVIGFGCKGDESPVGIVDVSNGEVIYAGDYSGQELDWDLRADVDAWKEWLTEGFGFDKLGVSVASGKLQFTKGDYRQMIRNPNIAKPFLRHFELMKGLDTEFVR